VLIEEFQDAHQLMGRRYEVLRHDNTASVHNAFKKNVCSLIDVMEEENEDLLVIDSKKITDPSTIEARKIS